MKNLGIVLLIIMAVMLAGCASAPEIQRSVMIDHQAGATRGYEIPGCYPDWVAIAETGVNSNFNTLYPDSVPFLVLSNDGENLDAMKFWANTFDVNAGLSRSINTFYAGDAGLNAKAENKAAFDRSADELARVSSQAQFSGLQKEAEYWILERNPDGKEVYKYYVLYLISKDAMNANIQRLLDGMTDESKVIATDILDKVEEKGLPRVF